MTITTRKIYVTGAAGFIGRYLLPALIERGHEVIATDVAAPAQDPGCRFETADIRDGNGVPFQIFYGISGNDHAFWSLVNARKVIGFAPEDNSAVRFADAVSAHIAAAKEEGAQ